ncbi:MAG: DUF748 domain-containing protein [Bacteroidales bacterium]|nr:DUF748 domain-containing protein [Bacteroidales bacterium]
MKKWLKIILIVCSSIVALLLLVLLLVSPIAKSYVNSHGKELIGRQINVGKLRVNALAGRVKIYDLVVYEDDDKTAFFRLDTFDVSLKLRRLLSHDIHVRHITIAHPQVRLLQDGNRFNFSSIIDHFKTDDEEPDNDTTPSAWSFGFYKIRLSDGEVYYADAKLKSEWDLKNLNLRIPGVYFDGSANTDAGLALQLADGGVLRTEASMNMDNNDFSVDLALENFAISNVKAYLADAMNIGRLDGTLNAAIDVDGNLSDIMKMNVKGNVALDEIDIRDDNDGQVLACNNIAIAVNRINLAENYYDIKSVDIDGLASHFDLYSNGNNFSRLTAKKAMPERTEQSEMPSNSQQSAASEKPDGAPKPLRFSVGSFAVSNAEFTYNDFSLPDRFSFPVKKINIKADHVTSQGDNNARIMAQLPHGGMAIVNWHGNIDSWKKNQHLVLNIKNLQLKDLSPYSVAYLGFPFTDGTFSFTSENSIRFSQLEGRNNIDLFNPEVGDKRSDVEAKVNIPLKAALYVLKDKDGKVDLDVPVAGNIDSPEFSYMKMVWKTLGNLMVKVATSPFRAVSKALGISGNLDYIAFNPLQANFNSEQYSTLNKIAEVLQYDTGLVVTLVPQINGEASYKQQSLYLLKEEYFISKNPDKANAKVPPQVVFFNEVNAITVKDTGFVTFVRRKGIASKKPTDKEVQRLAERLYPKDAAISSLENLAGFRNEYLRRFFFEQHGVNERQLKLAPVEMEATRSGYVINSEMAGDGESENLN